MTKLRFCVLFPLSLSLLAACAAAWPASSFDPQTMMDTNEIQRGARAVGKTVFSGTDICEFRLEIIDIMKRANLGADMILARVLDGPVVARQSGIIGGMSGSPVYINGRLIGAVAWGWGFQREPITGITPIRSMLEALDMMAGETAEAPAPQRWLARRPLLLDGRRFTAAQVLAPGQAPPPGVLPLRPVSTPINCNGMGARTVDFLRRKLARFGVEPMAGGGAQANPVPVDLVPGAAVGVRFMEGDFDMTGIGTVTYRTGDRILAFGHPMMQLGSVRLPLSTAWINDFMPSYEHSNKMGAGMTDIGVLRADIPWAVGGQVGPQAPLIPAHLEVVDHSRNYSRRYEVKVMRQPGLTPAVLAAAVSSALEAAYNPGYEGTVRTHFDLRGEKGAQISRDNQYYMQGAANEVALPEVADLMSVLEDNRWEPQGIAELSFRADLTTRDETTVVERVYAEENVAKAGKALTVHVLLRPDAGPLQEEVFSLKLPLDLPKGTLRVAICGGQDAFYLRSRLGMMVPDFDGLAPLLDYVSKMEQNKQLCVLAALPSTGLAFGTARLMHLPSSLSAVLEKSSRTDLNRGRDEIALVRDLPYVVYGRALLSLATEDRRGAKGAPTTSTSTTKPATETTPKSADEDEDDEVSTGLAPLGLWWAETALKPAAAVRLRQEAAEAGRPWPAQNARPKPERTPPAPAADVKGAGKSADVPPKAETNKEPEKDDEDEEAKAVIRQAAAWVQSKGSDFASGEARGTAIGTDGTVTLAPAVTELGKVPELQIWGAVATANGSYVSTTGPGRVYKLASGTPELLFDCQAFGVRALIADPAGNLYAGTWPGGRIYRITPDGKGSLYAQLPAQYVWSLAFDGGRLLAGTGPEGKLYTVDEKGQATELIDVPQAHILSLLPLKEGLYLGSGDKGLVYRLLPDRRLQTLLDTNGDDVTTLATDGQGRVYAGTATGGKVYRLEEGKAAVAVFDEKSLPVYSLAFTGGVLYAATGTEGKLLAVSAEGVHRVVRDTPMTHVLSLAAAPDGSLLAGTANVGEVLRFAPAAVAEGTFTSSVLDAKRSARWGAISWQASVPTGSTLAVTTRSGNSADPDDGSWSAWAAPTGQAEARQVGSPPARYLQYRVTEHKAEGGTAPVLRRLVVSYLTANQRPSVDLSGVDPEDFLHGDVEVRWSASDPDKDQLQAWVQYRPTGTADWKLIKELPAEKKTCTWSTAKLADGAYDLRVAVSDELSNPGDGATDESLVYGVLLDNTKPELSIQKTEAQDGRLVVEGLASDTNRVVEVAYQVGDQWRGALPLDGLFDTQYEQFRLTVPLKDGKAEVTVRVQDIAGNVQTQKVTWPLESAKEKDKEKE